MVGMDDDGLQVGRGATGLLKEMDNRERDAGGELQHG